MDQRRKLWNAFWRRGAYTLIACAALFASLYDALASNSPSWVQDSSWSASNNGGAAASGDNKAGAPGARRSTYQGGSNRRDIVPFAPNSHNIAVDIGQVFLMGDLTHYADNIGWRIHYTYGVSEIFGFDANLGYSEHSDGKFSLATGMMGLRTNLTWYDKVIPFVTFGLGFFRPAYQQKTASGAIENVAPFLFGIHLGPGVTLQLSRLFFFGTSVTFHNMFGVNRSNNAGGPGDVGGAFTTFLVHAGITL